MLWQKDYSIDLLDRAGILQYDSNQNTSEDNICLD